MPESPDGCFARMEKGTLSLGNPSVQLQLGRGDGESSGEPFLRLSDSFVGEDLEWQPVETSAFHPAHVRVTVQSRWGGLEIRRRFRLYAECPAIACDYDFRRAEENPDPIHQAVEFHEEWCGPFLHTRQTGVRFHDRTDEVNNLVDTQSVLPYAFSSQATADECPAFGRRIRLSGNLLLVENPLTKTGFFLLKEAPCHESQIAWPGYDFETGGHSVRVVGLGLEEATLRSDRWTRGYGVVFGTAQGGSKELLDALRCYQHILGSPQRDRRLMVQLNTWGDRSRDGRMGEAFALAELEAGARLGISHFMLDDGWQNGLSPNAVAPGGSFEGIWRDEAYWQVHSERFPRGLKPVLESAKAKGIELCLWFNPCPDGGYLHWEKDAGVMIHLFRQYGIRCFKIDGVEIPDKTAEENLRAMFDHVRDATEGAVLFTLDVTAGKRFGYFFFNEYGTVFLENRYTDFPNYFPHWTLRNLWMLAQFLPPQNFQIEFLNIWRNVQRYEAGDALAPSRVPFEYCFAITMAAQPLAWFEASYLPEEAFALSAVVRTFRQLQPDFHAHPIFPIGEEPDGTRWTGFQSCGKGTGFFLIYREFNSEPQGSLVVGDLKDVLLTCRCLLGAGRDFQQKPGQDGRVVFHLPSPFSYALWRYEMSPDSCQDQPRLSHD